MSGRVPSKRSIAREAQRLRLRPGWNPDQRPARESREHELRRSIEDERVTTVFGDADDCEQCRKARDETGDPTSLCAEHLRRAMGL